MSTTDQRAPRVTVPLNPTPIQGDPPARHGAGTGPRKSRYDGVITELHDNPGVWYQITDTEPAARANPIAARLKKSGLEAVVRSGCVYARHPLNAAASAVKFIADATDPDNDDF
jgi:hypothetical protein